MPNIDNSPKSFIAKIGNRRLIVAGEPSAIKKDALLKRIGSWLKDNVLPAVIIFITTTILGIFIFHWFMPADEQSSPTVVEPKVMPV